MHDKRRRWMLIMTVILIILIISLIIAVLMIHNFSSMINSEISADGMLAYIGSAVAGIGSIIVATIALWQTKQMQQENSEAQTRLEKLTGDANYISQRMLDLQEAENRPFLDLQPVRRTEEKEFYRAKRIDIYISNGNDVYFSHDRDFVCDEDEDFLSVFLKNVQEKEIISIGFKDIVIEIRDREGMVRKKYGELTVSCSTSSEAIIPHERVSMVIPLPENIWIENAKISSQFGMETAVFVGMTMRLINYQATEYEEKITFSAINAMSNDMATHYIFDKKETVRRMDRLQHKNRQFAET